MKWTECMNIQKFLISANNVSLSKVRDTTPWRNEKHKFLKLRNQNFVYEYLHKYTISSFESGYKKSTIIAQILFQHLVIIISHRIHLYSLSHFLVRATSDGISCQKMAAIWLARSDYIIFIRRVLHFKYSLPKISIIQYNSYFFIKKFYVLNI